MIIIENLQDSKKKVETYADLETGATFVFVDEMEDEQEEIKIKMKMDNGHWVFIQGKYAGIINRANISCSDDIITRVTIRGTVKYHR